MKEENEKDFPYVNVRSEPPQYCKVISLQLNKFKKLILCCRAFFFLFEKWIFEIEFKCHKIYAYKVYNLEGFFFFFFFFFTVFIELSDLHHWFVPEHFHHHKKKLGTPSWSLSVFSPLSPWKPLIFFLSLYFCLIWILHLNRKSVLLRLAFLT